ncbi:MAG: sulfurtransferase TusA [Pseudomonadota bacterium]|nr:sulfurtransferase TusA [Pseudomonadota bacterium]
MSDADLPIIELDTRGLNCPEPVMMLHQTMRRAQAGQQIRILATDPSTTRDIPKFCLHLGHDLLSEPQDKSLAVLEYRVQKRR